MVSCLLMHEKEQTSTVSPRLPVKEKELAGHLAETRQFFRQSPLPISGRAPLIHT